MSVQDLRNAVAAGTYTHEQAAAYDPEYQTRGITAAPSSSAFSAPAPPPAPVYTGPITRAVQDNELTSKNLATLSARGSPLVTQARTNAMETAAERGLGNSGMAAQSGEQGALSVMLPVAQADANTYSSTAAANQGYQNQFGLQGNQFEFQKHQGALDRDQATGLLQKNIENQRFLQDNQQQFARGESQLDRNQATGLLQKNIDASAAQLEKQQLFSGGQADKDRAARANEFTQTLTKQNDQFFAQNNLNRDQLSWTMQNASAVLNNASFSNYAAMMTQILEGTGPDKANSVKMINKLYFGNEDGTGEFKLKLAPNSLTPVAGG
ncbi:hypothetical protein [Janthinobacterium sp. B9-8]|uniref:hypothetical protein n=1 Tax=Janthinobacterium sp. B9-8 TaxID=1236179 RepID=UPI00061CDDAD|nr:hypothetical protein [Janthinobacterium sp. B9-8]AMC34728.1 hypothetical protein VN23_08960 [Janthinobacterium sp. B9-8]